MNTGSKLIDVKKIKLCKSNQIAIIAKFKNNNKNFTIINTKLKWVPEKLWNTKYAGYTQIENILLNQLPQQSRIIICGDFNVTCNSSVYKLLSHHNFKDIFLDKPYKTVKANKKASRMGVFSKLCQFC